MVPTVRTRNLSSIMENSVESDPMSMITKK